MSAHADTDNDVPTFLGLLIASGSRLLQPPAELRARCRRAPGQLSSSASSNQARRQTTACAAPRLEREHLARAEFILLQRPTAPARQRDAGLGLPGKHRHPASPCAAQRARQRALIDRCGASDRTCALRAGRAAHRRARTLAAWRAGSRAKRSAVAWASPAMLHAASAARRAGSEQRGARRRRATGEHRAGVIGRRAGVADVRRRARYAALPGAPARSRCGRVARSARCTATGSLPARSRGGAAAASCGACLHARPRRLDARTQRGSHAGSGQQGCRSGDHQRRRRAPAGYCWPPAAAAAPPCSGDLSASVPRRQKRSGDEAEARSAESAACSATG